MNRGVAAARSAVVSPTLAVIFLVALPFYMSKLVAAPSVCEYKVLIPLECLSQLCVKVLVEQARHLLSSLWWHCLFTCNKLVVDPQFASPVVLSGPLAIQVFKRLREVRRGQRAELGCEKLFQKSILGDTDLRPSAAE